MAAKKHPKSKRAPEKRSATKRERTVSRTVDELSQETATHADSIAWEAPQFAEYQRGGLWVLGLVAISFLLMAIFYTVDDYSAIYVVVAAAIVLYQQANAKPKIVTYRVDEDGFLIGTERLDWSRLKSFWLSAGDDDRPHLYLETTNRWDPILTIHLAKVDPLALRERLVAYLPEHITRGEALEDTLIRWLNLER
jgi:hypothetical protein